ncbi:MAG TPA: hypothetical protein VGQ37_16825 [Vicinamibacterales bacterium]|jgi:hypothetical protein|nr:hypothetical protein [Vicinamibacterales bacterium]
MADAKPSVSLLWRTTEAVAGVLSPAERLAVLGDLAESHARAGDALRHVAGLVLRRQFHHTCSMAGLIGIFVLALPAGIALSERGTHWAAGAGVYLWSYLDAGSVESLRRTIWATGSATGADIVAWVLLNAVTLAVWSCAAGWALGLFARRGIWMSVIAFYGIVLLNSSIRHGIGILPGHPAFAAFGVVAAATAVHGALLVIAPALYGLRWSLTRRPVSPPAMALLAVVAALLTYRAVGLS